MCTAGVDTQDVRQLSLRCACLKFKNIYTMFSVHNFMSFGLVLVQTMCSWAALHGYDCRIPICHSDECHCLNSRFDSCL